MVDFKDIEKLEELAKEGKTDEYMGKPKKGSFAERKASGNQSSDGTNEWFAATGKDLSKKKEK